MYRTTRGYVARDQEKSITACSEAERTSQLCVAPHCRYDHDTGEARPRQAAPGLRLCQTCRNRLEDDLAGLPELYKEAERALGSPARGAIERVSGSKPTGLLLNEVAVTARTTMVGVLACWAGMVAEERAVTKPERQVAMLAAFLLTHLDWLAAHPAAADIAEEIASLATNVGRAAHSNPSRRIHLGTCIHLDCNSAVYATIRDEERLLLRDVRCKTGHVWLRHQWPLLERRLKEAEHRSEEAVAAAVEEQGATNQPTRQQRRTVPTRLAAVMLGVPEATVRKWASRGKITRHGSSGRAEYDLEELAVLAGQVARCE